MQVVSILKANTDTNTNTSTESNRGKTTPKHVSAGKFWLEIYSEFEKKYDNEIC